MADTIVWLAAYPKTGSTWVRTIIQQMIAPDTRAKEAIASFEQEYPEGLASYPVMSTDAKIIRTHCHPEHKAFRAVQEQRSDRVAGVITVQRHPLDVLLSQLNYAFTRERHGSFKNNELKRAEDIIADDEIDHYIDAFIASGGCPEYSKRCLSYPDFYKAWRDFAPGASHLHLRYEDMVEDQEAAIAQIARFLHIDDIDPAELRDRVEQRTQLNGKFFWRKRAYNFRDLLPEDSIRRFERGFEGPLRELGYAS